MQKLENVQEKEASKIDGISSLASNSTAINQSPEPSSSIILPEKIIPGNNMHT
jgi:hypothetical protein